jgi:hypothetical protein
VKCIETVTKFLDLIKLKNSCVPVSISQIVQSAIKASGSFSEIKSLYENVYNRYCNYDLLNKKIVLDNTTEITKPFIEEVSLSDIPSSRNWKEVFDFSQTFDSNKSQTKYIVEKTAYLKIYFSNRRLIDSDSVTELRAVLSNFINEQNLDRNTYPNYEQQSFISGIISKVNNIIYNKLWEDK